MKDEIVYVRLHFFSMPRLVKHRHFSHSHKIRHEHIIYSIRPIINLHDVLKLSTVGLFLLDSVSGALVSAAGAFNGNNLV